MNLPEFFAMGGYAFYVWSAYGLTALLLAAEIVAVRARLGNARRTIQAAGDEA